MREADAFLKAQHFHLPPFAYWTPDVWASKGDEVQDIVSHGLGWDITDFGQGDFASIGLFLFTLRNGTPEALSTGRGKLYAEKIMVVEVGQVTPLHFHWVKTEDIINRGGGTLVLRLYHATENEGLSGADVTVTKDGMPHTVAAGNTVVLHPGESITIPPRCYHAFWGAEQRVLVGEVSLVNDDHTDNRFYESVGRFPEIDEDESPLYLLVNDYDRYVQPDQ